MSTLTPGHLRRMHAWWGAANHLSVGEMTCTQTRGSEIR